MKAILLSAYACDPSKGSEQGNGYHWASELQKAGYKVVCLTRSEGRVAIEMLPNTSNLTFNYVDLPLGLDKLYSLSRPTMYLHYLLWQWLAYKTAKQLNKIYKFNIAHHVTWGSLQLGSFMYKLGIPFIFGPAGGGQVAPVAFKEYFKEYWPIEVKREQTSKWLMKISPASKKMLQSAKSILVSNRETLQLALDNGCNTCSLVLDVSLPENFFPNEIPSRLNSNKLKLLWVGRLLPRKGVLLVAEVMEQLKCYSDIHLTIVGDGEMRGHLIEFIEKYKLTNINYVGVVPYEDVKEYYSTHDLFFFTSLRDSCPAQLFEAMAYGLPIITLQLHGQDAIVNEHVGIKCPVDNPEQTVEALKTAILLLYNDRNKLEQMGVAAFEYAKMQTWHNQINTVIKSFY